MTGSESVSLPDDLVDMAEAVGQKEGRSLDEQIAFWTRLGMSLEHLNVGLSEETQAASDEPLPGRGVSASEDTQSSDGA